MSNDREERLERLRRSVERWMDSAKSDGEIASMVEAAFLMAAADGDLSPVEYDQFAATLEYIYPDQGAEGVRHKVDQLTEALHGEGWEKRIAAVAGVLAGADVRRNAYRLVAGISFIDDEIQENEERLFGLLAEAFEIPSDEASEILQQVRDELFSGA